MKRQKEINMTNQTSSIRLNKFISDSGFCSRRAADKLIEEGRVTINGQYYLKWGLK